MRKLVIALIAALLILLCSCELFMETPKPGKVHILVYGNDYWFTESSKLNATVNDAVQVGIAISKTCEKAKLKYDVTYIYGENRLFDSEIDTTFSTIEPDTTKTSLLNHLEYSH